MAGPSNGSSSTPTGRTPSAWAFRVMVAGTAPAVSPGLRAGAGSMLASSASIRASMAPPGPIRSRLRRVSSIRSGPCRLRVTTAAAMSASPVMEPQAPATLARPPLVGRRVSRNGFHTGALAITSGAAAVSSVTPSSRTQCTSRVWISTVSGKPPTRTGPCWMRSPSARRSLTQASTDASARIARSCQAMVQPAANSSPTPSAVAMTRRRHDGRRPDRCVGPVVSDDDIA